MQEWKKRLRKEIKTLKECKEKIKRIRIELEKLKGVIKEWLKKKC